MIQSKITKNLISSLSIGSIYRDYHAFSSDTLGERKELLFTSSLQIAMKMSNSFQTKLGFQLNKNKNIGEEGKIAPFDYHRYLGTLQIDYHY